MVRKMSEKMQKVRELILSGKFVLSGKICCDNVYNVLVIVHFGINLVSSSTFVAYLW